MIQSENKKEKQEKSNPRHAGDCFFLYGISHSNTPPKLMPCHNHHTHKSSIDVIPQT